MLHMPITNAMRSKTKRFGSNISPVLSSASVYLQKISGQQMPDNDTTTEYAWYMTKPQWSVGSHCQPATVSWNSELILSPGMKERNLLHCSATTLSIYLVYSWMSSALADPRGAGVGHGPPRFVGKRPECTKSRHFQTQNRKTFLGRGKTTITPQDYTKTKYNKTRQ